MRVSKPGPKISARLGTESGARPSESQSLEAAIGSQVRALRKKNDILGIAQYNGRLRTVRDLGLALRMN